MPQDRPAEEQVVADPEHAAARSRRRTNEEETQASPEVESSRGWSVSGLAEGYYQWNFSNPSNGITNGRGFDTRPNTFTLSSALLEGKIDKFGFVGNAVLQFGTASVTSYLAEPTKPGTAWVAPSGANVWRIIQQVHLGYRIPIGRGLLVEAGIFLSPIGPEAPASKDNWNISRSTLFFALPFYHTGARATYALTNNFSATAAVHNGWNTIIDNNINKSVSASLGWTSDTLSASVLYFRWCRALEPATRSTLETPVRQLGSVERDCEPLDSGARERWV